MAKKKWWKHKRTKFNIDWWTNQISEMRNRGWISSAHSLEMLGVNNELRETIQRITNDPRHTRQERQTRLAQETYNRLYRRQTLTSVRPRSTTSYVLGTGSGLHPRFERHFRPIELQEALNRNAEAALGRNPQRTRSN